MGAVNHSLLDVYPGAVFSVSLRLLRNNYTGNCIRVRRSSDDSEQDIGFDVNGNLDTVELLNFVGNNDGFVSIWYDQSVESNDIINAALSEQPRVVSAGVVENTNGRSSVNFVSGEFRIMTNNTINMPTLNHTVFCVLDMINLDNFNRRWLQIDNAEGGTDTEFSHFSNSTTMLIGERVPNNQTINVPAVSGSTQTYYMTNSFSYQELGVNRGTVSINTSAIGHSTSVEIKLGYNKISLGEDFSWSGKIQEIIIYDFDNSANRVAIENNAFNHWKG